MTISYDPVRLLKRPARLLIGGGTSLKRRINRLWINYLDSRYRLPTVDPSLLVNGDAYDGPVILEDCFMPPYRGEVKHDDMGFLLNLALARQPQLVLELGTAYGNSAANVCQVVPDCRVSTVNALPEQISGSHITRTFQREEIGRVYRSRGFDQRVTQIYANTLNLDLSPYLKRDTVDLAVVDACHDTDYVLNDFYVVEPFVRDGGIVLFHDTHPSMAGHLLASYLACLKLRQRGFDVRHTEDTWWAIWVKGGFPPSA